MLSSCRLCPRECGVDRFESGSGFCGGDAGLNIASICVHRGEEPPISGPHGICNIFFAGSNMRCIYCQNHAISRPGSAAHYDPMDLKTCLGKVEEILSNGVRAVGFVSPSHAVPQMKAIIRGLWSRGLRPVIVYNTNSYDKVETFRDVAYMVDVYLPDYKYITYKLSSSLSGTYDYPLRALRALKEMYYQKGSGLLTDEGGIACRGMIIRHLILPGHTGESIKILKSVAEEFSAGVHFSLMSQYHPADGAVCHHTLGRTFCRSEYEKVAVEMEQLGFRNGWLQDMQSYNNYLPDFSKEHPFE